MSDMLNDYADWVRQTCACNSCVVDALRSVHCLVNRNINAAFESMPQSGYLGLDYQTSVHRVLVLGKNPAGGPDGDLNNDAEHYPKLLRISDTVSLKEESGPLQRLYNNWKPLKSLNLEKRVGLKPSEIVYANQILCRSDNHKPNINRGLIGENRWQDVRSIYISCYQNRLLELIRILEPHHIIALGKKQLLAESWPVLLEQLLNAELPKSEIKVWPIVFPTRYNKWAEDDLIPIREYLGILPK